MEPNGPSATVEAAVEIPKGNRNKYKVDHTAGIIRLNWVLFASIHYPTDCSLRALHLRRLPEEAGTWHFSL
jgi:inorganic pyrophosphatase